MHIKEAGGYESINRLPCTNVWIDLWNKWKRVDKFSFINIEYSFAERNDFAVTGYHKSITPAIHFSFLADDQMPWIFFEDGENSSLMRTVTPQKKNKVVFFSWPSWEDTKCVVSCHRNADILSVSVALYVSCYSLLLTTVQHRQTLHMTATANILQVLINDNTKCNKQIHSQYYDRLSK